MKALAVSLALVLAPAAIAEEITPTENTHGCLMKFCNIAGGCSFIFFVKVADDEYDSDDGDSQIWGYNPEDKQYDRKGRVRYVAVLAKRFIRAGGAGMIEGQGCACRCPSW